MCQLCTWYLNTELKTSILCVPRCNTGAVWAFMNRKIYGVENLFTFYTKHANKNRRWMYITWESREMKNSKLYRKHQRIMDVLLAKCYFLGVFSPCTPTRGNTCFSFLNWVVSFIFQGCSGCSDGSVCFLMFDYLSLIRLS